MLSEGPVDVLVVDLELSSLSRHGIISFLYMKRALRRVLFFRLFSEGLPHYSMDLGRQNQPVESTLNSNLMSKSVRVVSELPFETGLFFTTTELNIGGTSVTRYLQGIAIVRGDEGVFIGVRVISDVQVWVLRGSSGAWANAHYFAPI